MKGFALRLVLKQRHKRTRKWFFSEPICTEQCDINTLFRIFRRRIWSVTGRCPPTSRNNQDTETRRSWLSDDFWSSPEKIRRRWITYTRSGVEWVVNLTYRLVRWGQWEISCHCLWSLFPKTCFHSWKDGKLKWVKLSPNLRFNFVFSLSCILLVWEIGKDKETFKCGIDCH